MSFTRFHQHIEGSSALTSVSQSQSQSDEITMAAMSQTDLLSLIDSEIASNLVVQGVKANKYRVDRLVQFILMPGN